MLPVLKNIGRDEEGSYTKNEVKKLSGRWDLDIKKWYISKYLDVKPFKKWIPANENAAELTAISPVYGLESEEL